jgi:multicomponent Na+:H+ antiporter subunit E
MKARLLAYTTRLFLFAVLWLLLAGTRAESVIIAVVGIAAATIASLVLWPASDLQLRWTRMPALALYFLLHSLRGGLDVAQRAFSPTLPVAPDFIRYETTLGSEAARVLFTWMIGMMPGTSSVHLEQGNRLTVHVIDIGAYNRHHLEVLERKLAVVFDGGRSS